MEFEDYDGMERLKELGDAFFIGEFYEGKLILPQIIELLKKIGADSSISVKIKQIKLKMIIDNIARNRWNQF